jgi:hypothetical protein
VAELDHVVGLQERPALALAVHPAGVRGVTVFEHPALGRVLDSRVIGRQGSPGQRQVESWQPRAGAAPGGALGAATDAHLVNAGKAVASARRFGPISLENEEEVGLPRPLLAAARARRILPGLELWLAQVCHLARRRAGMPGRKQRRPWLPPCRAPVSSRVSWGNIESSVASGREGWPRCSRGDIRCSKAASRSS